MKNHQWLQNLKVGDQVIVHCAYVSDRIVKVERLTKTLIILNNKTRISKSNGYEYGSHGYNLTSISQFTETKAAQINTANIKQKLINGLNNTKFHKLALTKLQQIYNIVNEDA